MLSSLLSACAGMFKPKRTTIEYDEQVKLHTGEMIWVHITRHYFLSGGAIGDPGWDTPNYMPSAVEISWDTGFKGVGRKSVFFDEYVGIIDKYNDKWYVIGEGSKNRTLPNSTSSEEVGFSIDGRQIVVVNQKGEFVEVNPEDIQKFNRKNIIFPYSINDWGLFPQPLNGKKLTWQDKLSLQEQQPSKRQTLEQPLFKEDK